MSGETRIDFKWVTVQWAGSSASGKTEIWTVRNSDNQALLGEIRWHGPWRKYTFVPAPLTVFEEDCLRDIANFVQDMTLNHRHGQIDEATAYAKARYADVLDQLKDR